MNDNMVLCSVCGINELVNEMERMSEVCDDCGDPSFEREYAEQDFDELLEISDSMEEW